MKKRGKGISCVIYGIGNTGMPNPSSAFVEICVDGSAIVLCGAVDMGQGTSTALVQIAAHELGLDAEDVVIRTGNSAVTPDAGLSTASRQIYISGNAVKKAASVAKQVIMEEAATILNSTVEDLEARDGFVTYKKTGAQISFGELVSKARAKGKLAVGAGSFNPASGKLDEDGQGDAYATYHYCTQIVEVEVDTETGEVEVISVVAAHDAGKAINPQSIEGQIEGGVAMGLGYGLMEDVVTEQGHLKTPSLAEYLIPTSLDMAATIRPLIVEVMEPTGPFGAKGMGEPPTCPTAAAIANAVYDATGVWVNELPLTSEKVYNALERDGKLKKTDPSEAPALA